MQHAQPQQFNMVNAALNANSWFMPYDQNRPAAQYEQVQLPIMPQVSAIQEAVRAAEMQQSATSNAREPSSSSSQPPVWFQQPVRTSMPQAPQTPEQVAVATASEVVSIFAEVHAARFAQAERSRPQSRPRNEVRPFSNQCTICQQTFNQGVPFQGLSVDTCSTACASSTLNPKAMQYSVPTAVRMQQL